MKPISVKFECFGPYLEPQFVDFSQLEKSGLFLICGDTGSGKTTILEAMCYALYGKSSGGSRGDLIAMRNKQAPAHKPTSVEFIFEVKGMYYRFYRSLIPIKSRKSKQEAAEDSAAPSETKFREDFECQYMVDETFIPIEDSKATQRYMNKKAEELIGLSHAQFCQVILLPQGKFETLLVSNSNEKEEILTTLFQAQRWNRVAAKLHARAHAQDEQVKQEHSRIIFKLEHYGCKTPEELAQKASTLQEMLQQITANLEAAQKDYDSKLAQWKEVSQIEDAFCKCDAAKKLWEELQRSEAQYKLLEQSLQLSDKADEVADSFSHYHSALEDKQGKSAKLSDAKAALEQMEQALATLSAQWEAHEKGRAANEQNKSTKAYLEGKRDVYSSLMEKEIAVSQAEATCTLLKSSTSKAEAALSTAGKELEAAFRTQAALREEQAQAQALYLRGIGFVLAEQLEDNEPCPVCGSTVHPQPAKAIDGHITDEMLDSINKKLDEAASHSDACRKKAKDAEATYNEVKSKYEEALRSKAAADSAYESAKEQCIADISDSAALEKKIQELQKGIQAYEIAESKLQASLLAARTNQGTARSLAEAAETAFNEAAERFKERQASWEEARTEAGFSDDAHYQSACMEPEEKNQKRIQLISFHKDLQSAKKDYEDKQEALVGKERPDLKQIEALLQLAEKRRQTLITDLATGEKELSTMNADIEALTVAVEKYQRNRHKADEALEFSKRITGSSGVSLQRYVLGVMMTAITATANQILKKVCGGRYQLSRSDEASGRVHQKGLELDVYTSGSQDSRKVNTLSGGEKFLVSLCLAIGLSTVVQAQGHGVHMDAMFIDEGFGSLDKSRIQDALDVLDYIRGSSGMVGIISHVDAMSENIHAKIRVTKTDRGSECRICL
ncbi:MAG: SMC family ATPase [Oscillospiraceae bacterium]|nr:SMC family ATPase [Oscillospiraceae bacterium]